MATRKPHRATRRRKTKTTARTAPSARLAPKKKAAAGKAATAQKERRRKDPATLRVRLFEPTFTVNDLERSVRFYTDVLGFIVGDRWTEDGQLKGVLLRAGASSLGLSQDDWSKGRDRKKGVGLSIWCQTEQDIDALAGRIKAAGGRLTEEPKDEQGVGRSLAVDDPDGFRLRLYRR